MQRLFLLVFGLVLATLAAPPPSFDARVAYPQCLGPVVSQGECDSSLLLASLADLSASACLSTRVSGVKLSDSYVAECCVNCDIGCNGADMTAIVQWLTVNGTVTQGCAGPNVSTCPLTKCVDNSPLRYYRAKFVKLSSLEEIQNAIMATGPVLAYVDATPFEVYNGGIMSCSSSNKNLNDVVSLLGWGTRGGVPYWLGVNTWGPDWGENGYFQILRGHNACGIETIDYAVQYVGR